MWKGALSRHLSVFGIVLPAIRVENQKNRIMSFAEILIAILMAMVVGVLFYYVFRVSGPWGSFWTFLLILLLAGIASTAWLTPVGPPLFGEPWLGTLFVILFLALLISAATPPQRTRTDVATPNEPASTGAIALGFFFWILIIFLAIAAIWGVSYPPYLT